MKKVLLLISALVVSLISLPSLATVAYAKQTKVTALICPSVSLKNPQGMWVIGEHGAYRVILKGKEATIPEHVLGRAQVPPEHVDRGARWGLYKNYLSYPWFEGMAGILIEGINTWLASDPDRNTKFWEFDAVMVTYNSIEDKTTITNLGMNMGSPTDRGGLSTIIDGYIPIYSAVFW